MLPVMASRAPPLHLSLLRPRLRPPQQPQAVSPYPRKVAAVQQMGSISPQPCPAWPWPLASLSPSPGWFQVPGRMPDGPCTAHLVNHQPSWRPDRLPHYLVTPCEDFLPKSSVYSSLLSHLPMCSLYINFVIVFDLPSDCTGAH